MNPDDYDAVQSLLASAGVELTPAEFHGQVTGLWCRYPRLPHDLGIADAPTNAVAWPQLVELAGSVWRALEDPECGYSPLLPADDSDLDERVAAMVDWCGALLYGIGHAGELDAGLLEDEIGEALTDIRDISQAELGGEGAEDEAAFAEIVEYLRVLAQTLYVELHPRPSATEHHEH